MVEDTENKKMIEVMLTYFLYHFNVRSQNQHRNMCTYYRGFMNCFPNSEADEYIKKLDRLVEKPIKYFVNHKKSFLTKDQERKLDTDFSLAQLDFLYFRDTSFANQLKTNYAVTYKRPTRNLKMLTLNELIEVMAFVRDELLTDVNEIARKWQIEVPIILPQVHPHEQGGVGIGGQGFNF